MKLSLSYKVIFCFLLFSMATTLRSQDIFDIARSGTLLELKIFLENEPESVFTLNDEGYSPLIIAGYHGNEPIVAELIAQGIDIDQTSGYGTALMAATVKGHTEIVALLLQHSANPNTADKNGTTSLIYCALFQRNDIAGLLLKHNADVSLKDNRGNTALDYAKLLNNTALIQLLNVQL